MKETAPGSMDRAPSLLSANWTRAEDRFLFEGAPGVVVWTTARSFSMPAGEQPEPGKFRAYVEATGPRPRSVAGMGQVHGARIEEVRTGQDRVVSSCDGLVTGSPGVALVVRTADCLPIAAIGPGGRRLGVAHAGWRGIRAGIPRRLVERMGGPDLEIAIGPGIGPCCYEVGPEFEDGFPDYLVRRKGRRFLDLIGAARAQLAEAGVPPERIHAAGWCTACSPEFCHSFRRDGAASGRMLTVAMLL